MKRATFKKPFNGMDNAIKLIPESYKVDGNEFQITDGVETYDIRWDINEATIIRAENKNFINEDMQKIKHLMGFKSQDTLGNLKGADRINENKSFNDVWGKTKKLLSESEDERETLSEYGFTGEGNLENNKEYKQETPKVRKDMGTNLVEKNEVNEENESGTASLADIRGKIKGLLSTFNQAEIKGKEKSIVDQLLDLIVELGGEGNSFSPVLQTKLDLFKKAVADAEGGDEGDEGALTEAFIDTTDSDENLKEIDQYGDWVIYTTGPKFVAKNEDYDTRLEGDSIEEIKYEIDEWEYESTAYGMAMEKTDRFNEIFEDLYSEEGEEFIAHGTYTLGNAGGYEVMLSDDGEAAKVRDAYGSDNPQTSDWLEIEYVPGEDGEMEPVIDPQGYDIPLNMVMRLNELENTEKADLNKDGEISSYEEKRGEAIEKAMKDKVSENDMCTCGPHSNPSGGEQTNVAGYVVPAGICTNCGRKTR